MLSLLIFVVQNKNVFLTNHENNILDTRQKNNFCLPQANVTIYQKRAYYSGIKFFNNLPLRLKMLPVTEKNLKVLWKNFYTLIYFTQWKSALVNRELSAVSQGLYYSGMLN